VGVSLGVTLPEWKGLVKVHRLVNPDERVTSACRAPSASDFEFLDLERSLVLVEHRDHNPVAVGARVDETANEFVGQPPA
jgi:hypothetical protein